MKHAEDAELREARGLLGLPASATPAEVRATCRELEKFLAPERVSRRLRRWAEQQRGLASQLSAGLPDVPEPASVPVSPKDLPDYFAEDQAYGQLPAPRKAPGTSRPAPKRSRVGTGRSARWSGVLNWRSAVLLAAIGLVVAGVALSSLPRSTGQTPSGPPVGAPAAAEAPAPPKLDEARVAALRAVVEKDPKNADALFELGELNFQAGHWQDSIDWFTRLLAVDPGNVHARSDVGTANFNLGNYDQARQAWEDVLARNPQDPQIHYNLGFLYANGEAKDLDRALQEWQKVIELAPDSPLAKTARAHLEALKK